MVMIASARRGRRHAGFTPWGRHGESKSGLPPPWPATVDGLAVERVVERQPDNTGPSGIPWQAAVMEESAGERRVSRLSVRMGYHAQSLPPV